MKTNKGRPAAEGCRPPFVCLQETALIECACHAMAKHSLFSAILINSPAKLRQPELPHGLHYPGNIYIKTCGFARTSVLCIFSPLRLTMATYFAINDAKSPIDLHGANDKSATPPARLTQPWQNRHQNVRLGRENSSITFFAVTRYHGDVIRNKLPPLT